MWENPIARQNVAKLSELGYRFIGPEPGWLACRNVGVGRLTEPETIFSELVAILAGTENLPTPVIPKASDHG
jgi:phosphopantothenoylcysteine decarboxylase/phosphopantothenate--cysteine ligase